MTAAVQDWTRVMNQARVKLPGASDSGIKGELFDVFQEFFNDSSCWLEALTFNVLPNVVVYDIVPTEGGVIRLAGVVDSHGSPQPSMMPNFGQVALSRIPSVADTFTAVAVLNVDLPVDKNAFPVVPSWVLPIYSTGILDGLLGRMMGHASKSYSNATLSMFHLRKFKSAIVGARIATLRNNTFGTQAWSYPQAFRTMGQRGGVSIGNDTRFTT